MLIYISDVYVENVDIIYLYVMYVRESGSETVRAHIIIIYYRIHYVVKIIRFTIF